MTELTPREPDREPDAPESSAEDLFRAEAVQATALGNEHGDVIRIAPGWLNAVYHLLIWFTLVGLVFCIFTHVDEYASGQAVIRYANLVELGAKRGGTLRSIDVKPGDVVKTGDVLARFFADEEEAEYERAKRDFNLQLVKALRDPNDTAAHATLASLRTSQELAASRLEGLTVRAPNNGVVGDVRARPGQYLNPGDTVVTLSKEGAKLEVIAMLPGYYRPQLKPGMKLRIEPSGYKYAYQLLSIDEVDDQIVGPAQIQKYLGRDLADAVKLDGSVVVVRAHPPSNSFVANGTRYEYHHGMVATAESSVRSESVINALVPGLRAISEGSPLGYQ